MFLERWAREILGEDVGSLIAGSNLDKLNCFGTGEVADEMHFDLEMFVASGDTMICSHENAGSIVFEHDGRGALGKANLGEQLTKP